MRAPLSTYRVQLSRLFTFSDLAEIVPYLHKLGITDIYASPILCSREGSAHGYDMTDPGRLDPELGGERGFRELCTLVRRSGMGWLQDIVPNHMAYSAENRLLADVLEKGAASSFSGIFDIRWDHPDGELRGKLLAPFLGDGAGECIRRGELSVVFDRDGFSARYWDRRFPLAVESYEIILAETARTMETVPGCPASTLGELLGELGECMRLAAACRSEDTVAGAADMMPGLKELLWKLYGRSEAFRTSLEKACTDMSPGELAKLLEDQHYVLDHWKRALRQINYRRFFDISDLIAVRVEDLSVFEKTHARIFDLVASGAVSGLRIDHVDGLGDPGEYLARVKERVPEAYLVVEKILEPGESLPDSWPVHGTTGYDFLGLVNGIFCRQEQGPLLSALYEELVAPPGPFLRILAENKRMVAERYFAADVRNLAADALALARRLGVEDDIPQEVICEALVGVLSAFPVYRTYISGRGVESRDAAYLKRAFEISGEDGGSPGDGTGVPGEARGADDMRVRCFGFLRKAFGLDDDDGVPPDALPFVKRFQQLAGPLMAKGLEDTTLYTFNRLIGLNEVGSDPGRIGISLAEFHHAIADRRRRWPLSMNATGTHDTKRGEDARARLAVLTELAGEWGERVKEWKLTNAPFKVIAGGKRAPDGNEEYFLYQTLLGAFPFSEAERPRFFERMNRFVVKMLREAKRNSSWIEPSREYEDGCVAFLAAIFTGCGSGGFYDDFLSFQKRVAGFGIWNSLSQLLVKVAAPGIPDIYQGSELWDFSLVDPDNRSPVDYPGRIAFLKSMENPEGKGRGAHLEELLAGREDGRIKQFVLWRALSARKEHPELFLRGDYEAVEAAGRHRENVVSFARRWSGFWAIPVVPRFTVSLVDEKRAPVGPEVWGDTCIVLPPGAPRVWTDAMTGRELRGSEALQVGGVLRRFPVALLTSEVNDQHSRRR